MNVIFWALDLGAPSAVEVVETSRHDDGDVPGLEHHPLRVGRRAASHPPLKIYWYDGGKQPSAQGSISRGPAAGRRA